MTLRSFDAAPTWLATGIVAALSLYWIIPLWSGPLSDQKSSGTQSSKLDRFLFVLALAPIGLKAFSFVFTLPPLVWILALLVLIVVAPGLAVFLVWCEVNDRVQRFFVLAPTLGGADRSGIDQRADAHSWIVSFDGFGGIVHPHYLMGMFASVSDLHRSADGTSTGTDMDWAVYRFAGSERGTGDRDVISDLGRESLRLLPSKPIELPENPYLSETVSALSHSDRLVRTRADLPLLLFKLPWDHPEAVALPRKIVLSFCIPPGCGLFDSMGYPLSAAHLQISIEISPNAFRDSAELEVILRKQPGSRRLPTSLPSMRQVGL